MRNKYVQVISHPTGRILNKRDAYQVNREKLFYLAKETNTYLEINSQPERLDLGDSDARRARDLGVKLVISTDAHDSRSLIIFATEWPKLDEPVAKGRCVKYLSSGRAMGISLL